jgi:hypothetical protein
MGQKKKLIKKMNTKSIQPLFIFSIICVLILATVLSGCTGTKTLTGSQKDAVLVYSEPIVDNLLQGMNDANYAAFSRDFDAQMLSAIPEANFTSSLLPTVVGKLGKYISRQVTSVTEIGSNVTIVYNAKFENTDNVTITLTLHQAAPHQVAGLYFNSPLLK